MIRIIETFNSLSMDARTDSIIKKYTKTKIAVNISFTAILLFLFVI